MMGETLQSWKDGDARRAIEAFVAKVTTTGSREFLPPEERVAVFDNDGTLWCEKPMPVELGFILTRLAVMANEQPALRDLQPWKAAHDRDYSWLGETITKHYQGDDRDVKVLLGGILKAFEGMSVETYQAAATAFLQQARHPTLDRRFRECGYLPMVELLRYLEANGFVSYIVSGGDRDFMRAVTSDIYGIPAERVVGSTSALTYTETDRGGTLAYLAKPDIFDDGPVKPVRIWSRIGRRPILAAGNSNGDMEMLGFTHAPNRPALRMLLLHDDAEREFAYTGGAERVIDRARAERWTTVSMSRDWSEVFARPQPAARGAAPAS